MAGSLEQVQFLELHLHPPPHQDLHSIQTRRSVMNGRTFTIVAKVTTWRLFAESVSALVEAPTSTCLNLVCVSFFLMNSSDQVQRDV